MLAASLGELRDVRDRTSTAARQAAFLHALVSASESDIHNFLFRKCDRISDGDLRRLLSDPLASECYDIVKKLATVDALKHLDAPAPIDAWKIFLQDGTVTHALLAFAETASAATLTALRSAEDAMSTGSYSDYSDYSESHEDSSSSESDGDGA